MKLVKGFEVTFAGYDCIVFQDRYRVGDSLALLLHDKYTGERIASASVNLPAEEKFPTQIFVLNTGEAQGMVEALSAANIIEPQPVKSVRSGWIQVGLYELTQDFLRALGD